MKKFEGWLFATDLDGTLLDDEKNVSRENLEAIEYFKSEGGLFTFVTGRIPAGARHIVDIVKPNAPFACIQGGGVFDPCENKLLWAVEMPHKVFDMIEYIEDLFPTVGIELNVPDKIYFCKKNIYTEKHRTDERFDDLTCKLREVPEPFSKVLIVDSADKIPEIAKALHEHPLASEFDFVRSDEWYYEILVKGTNKGRGLEKLCEILGIDKKKTIAAGDQDNDEMLLKSAEFSFAVANASPTAKNSAKFVTVSNNESAIAEIIYNIEKYI